MYRQSTPSTHISTTGSAAPRRWPLERALFAIAGSIILLSVALVALVSPWFLILTGVVGINQSLYAAIGVCPVALLLERRFGYRSVIYPEGTPRRRQRAAHPATS